MRLIIWGTGRLYRKYKDFLFQFDIVKLCDSNPDKQGTILDGVEIIKPSCLIKQDFEFVVVMTTAAKQICNELEKIGISDSKIILYSQLCLLNQSQIHIYQEGKDVSFNKWCAKNESDILLISHNYSYTGVPVALRNMANVLRKMGYSVLMAALEGGPLSKELDLDGIGHIDNLEMFFQTDIFGDMLNKFKAVVIGSFSLYHVAVSLNKNKVPVLWWVHETHKQYFIGKEELPQGNNIRFFAGGNRVRRIFNSYYKKTDIKKLQYCIPDFYNNISEKKMCPRLKQYLKVAMIGTLDNRKAQDILLEAVVKMPCEYRKEIKIFIIGNLGECETSYIKKIEILKKQIENIEWIYEMSQKELDIFYEDIDVLVCPSRDDPMPVVVTQAMMHEKVCIVSENVGQAEFIKQSENGFVIPNEDSNKLMKILMWLLDNREQCTLIGKASRKIYENEFSEKIMERELNKILKEVCN